MQGYLVVRHCRDVWWLDTAGILGGSAMHGYLVFRRCGDISGRRFFFGAQLSLELPKS